MGIIDDLGAFGIQRTDAHGAAAAIESLAAAPTDRLQLVREWEAATGLTMPADLVRRLSETGAREKPPAGVEGPAPPHEP